MHNAGMRDFLIFSYYLQSAVLQACEPLSVGQAAPPQEAGMVALLLLLCDPEPHDLEQAPHDDQEDTEQLTVRMEI